MSWSSNPVILRFDNASFYYGEDSKKKIILDESDFTIRENTKITLMGQNGAGKSSIFKMIMSEEKLNGGKIHITPGTTIAIAKQVIPRDQIEMTVREYFETAFSEKDYQLDKKINDVLKDVNLVAPLDKQLKDFSGWQQARLLLAYALIQKPDILLLDEPTNNLDKNGIGELITFLMMYDKTVVVISHDADFLNIFTEWVLYLNIMTHKVEQYRGNYSDALDQIAAQIEKDQMLNAREEKRILDAKEKINFFSNKWGKMRKIANKMREEVEEAEDNKVDVRKDDRTIRPFVIPFDNYVGPIVTVNSVSLMDPETQTVSSHILQFPIEAKKGDRYILSWPNGIGKSTLLKKLINAHDDEAMIHKDVKVWYYSQDFNALDMNMIVRDALHEMSNEITDQEVYKVASALLLTGDVLKNPIYCMSEWQKWLLCYARFVIQRPDLLILDEPTNHINFRHLPIIAESLNDYAWAIIMVSHDEWFVSQIENLKEVDLGRLLA